MKKLTKAEEEIMQIIWKLGPCTVSQIIKEIPDEPKPPHSSISSLVRLIEKKGFLSHKAYGKTYEYRPAVQKADYGKKTLGTFIADYFGGSANSLVSFLVKEEQISPEELKALLDQIEGEE